MAKKWFFSLGNTKNRVEFLPLRHLSHDIRKIMISSTYVLLCGNSLFVVYFGEPGSDKVRKENLP